MKKNFYITGFSLVEVMVVVAIIGILSAVAIPNFQAYQSKSRQTEAKLMLASIYTSQLAFFSSYDTYATCLRSMGFTPLDATTGVSDGYYAIGFNSGGRSIVNSPNLPNTCSPPDVDSQGESFWIASKGYAGSIANNKNFLPVTNVTSKTYLVAASGVINKNKTTNLNCDQWTMNESKKMINVRQGL